MSDSNLRYKSVSITTQQIGSSAWTKLPPGANTGKMVIQGAGGFKIADSSAPGANFYPVASGSSFGYEGGADIYGNAPVNTAVHIVRYS